MEKKGVEVFISGMFLVIIVVTVTIGVFLPQYQSMTEESGGNSLHAINMNTAERMSNLLLRANSPNKIGILDTSGRLDTEALSYLAGERYWELKTQLALDKKDFTIRAVTSEGKAVHFSGGGSGSGKTFAGWSAEVLMESEYNGGYNYEAFQKSLLIGAANIAELSTPITLSTGERGTLYVTVFDSEPDSDGDGLPDVLEVMFNLNPSDPTGDNGGSGDPDGDGLPNIEEFVWGTNPWNPNTDNDFDPTTCAPLLDGFEADMNEGGDLNWDPTDRWKPYPQAVADVNGNNIPDCWETNYGITDIYGDEDGDGVLNYIEYNFGTDPTNANTYYGIIEIESDFQFILLNPTGTTFTGGSGGETDCKEASDDANVPANAGHANDPNFPINSAGLCKKVCDAGGSCTPPTAAGESGPDCDKRPGTCSSDCCACEANFGPVCPNGCKETGEECDKTDCPIPGEVCNPLTCQCDPAVPPLPEE